MRRTIVLAILDGWGIGERDESNPIYIADPKQILSIEREFPGGALQASGIAVGLPWEEEGNSEVGHLTIGAGKVLYQHYPKISLAIEDGSFFKNPILLGAFAHARANGGVVHLAGLLTSGNVHASLKHLLALIRLAEIERGPALFLHLFTDGKDSPPRSAPALLDTVEKELARSRIGSIASIMGRYYAMNRDQRWNRTEKAYHLLTEGKGTPVENPRIPLQNTYAKGMEDEFVEPARIGEGRQIRENDSVIFFNFREDSMRQITEPFLNPSFSAFKAYPFKNLYCVTMTSYHEALEAHVAFPNDTVEHPLGEVLATNKKTQLRIAETEKYAHVTYFFNGLKENPYPQEFRILIPSQNVLHHDEHPEMMASAITDRVLVALNEGAFNFILVNYANLDLVAHTGNYDATVKAVRVVDEEVGRLKNAILEGDHILLLTSDHGNAEKVLDLRTGQVETKHDPNPVPLYLVAKEFARTHPLSEFHRLPPMGLLSDIAPTVLELMDLPKPNDMTGQSLLEELRAQKRV